MRSVPEGSVCLEREERYGIKSLHWVTGENGSCRGRGRNSAFPNFRDRNGSSERETFGHHLFPGSQMAWNQNPGTCFLVRPSF